MVSFSCVHHSIAKSSTSNTLYITTITSRPTLGTLPIRLRQATCRDNSAIARVGALVNYDIPADTFLHPHRSKHWQDHARGYYLDAEYGFYHPGEIIVVAQIIRSEEGRDVDGSWPHSETQKDASEEQWLVTGAAKVLFKTQLSSPVRSLPEWFRLPQQTLIRRLRRLYYSMGYELYDRLLDRSVDRKKREAL